MPEECHVCGKPAVGSGFVEGARVALCGDCSAYSGDFKEYYIPPKQQRKPTAFAGAPLPTELQRPKDAELELREDYAKIFKTAMEQIGPPPESRKISASSNAWLPIHSRAWLPPMVCMPA